MYSEEDMKVINGKIRKNWLVLAPILVIILSVYIYALRSGVEWLAMVMGPLLFVAACYGLLAYLVPNIRYRNFLLDMENGLSRDMKGRIVEISQQAEPQDGAMVLPVRVFLDDIQDEHIVYLNASKRDRFPDAGADVLLHCYGRHIRSVERM